MGGQILVELPDTKFRENLNLFRVYKTEASTCAAQRYQEERRRKTKKKQRRTKRLSQRQGGAKITLTTPRHPKSSLPHTFYHTDTALTSPHADLKVIHSPTLHASQRAVFRLRLPGPDTA